MAAFCILFSGGAIVAALVVGVRAERPLAVKSAERVCYVEAADVGVTPVATCDRVVLALGPEDLCDYAATDELRVACHAAAFERNLPLDHPDLWDYANPEDCAALPYRPAVRTCDSMQRTLKAKRIVMRPARQIAQ